MSIAENPLLLEVAMAQGLTLEDLCGRTTIPAGAEPALATKPVAASAKVPASVPSPAEAGIAVLPPASVALAKENHPAVTAAMVRVSSLLSHSSDMYSYVYVCIKDNSRSLCARVSLTP